MAPNNCEQLTISGLPIKLHSHFLLSTHQDAAENSTSLSCVFLLHGRLGCSDDMSSFVGRLLSRFGNLLVVTFDHRNHGHRLVSAVANEGWTSGNPRHAVDMYATQLGTAQDVSLLIDLLPAYLFPSAERMIASWGVIGVSLGGHSSWLAAALDPRLSYVVPVIGSPDYERLMSHRASRLAEKGHPISFEPPHVPASLLDLIRQKDPCRAPMDVWRGRKIFVVSGQRDKLVNFVDGGSEEFVHRLNGNKACENLEVFIDQDAQHEVTELMMDRIVDWMLGLQLGQPSHL